MADKNGKIDSLGTSGLSRREVLQSIETGDTFNGELAVWRCRIRDKIQPTIVDTRLLLENVNQLGLADDLESIAGDDIRRIVKLAKKLNISKS